MGGGDGEIKETSAEKAQAKVAMKRWGDYQNIFNQYENDFMGEVDSWNSSDDLDLAETISARPLASTFSDQSAAVQKNLNASGVNPNSGKAKVAKSALGSAQASAEVDAGSRGVSSQQDRYVSGLQSIVAMGQGQAGESISGMTDIADSAQRNAQYDAQIDRMERDNVRSAVGLAVGAGTSYGLTKYAPKANRG
tara:strand:- start:22 stop:603 length:582 start_codon:yes stop_codon:yes gene_type:complete